MTDAPTPETEVPAEEPVETVPDAPAEPGDELAQALARIAELEAENEALRESPPDPQFGEVTAQLTFYEAEQFKAEVQAWERETGQSYYDEVDA